MFVDIIQISNPSSTESYLDRSTSGVSRDEDPSTTAARQGAKRVKDLADHALLWYVTDFMETQSAAHDLGDHERIGDSGIRSPTIGFELELDSVARFLVVVVLVFVANTVLLTFRDFV